MLRIVACAAHGTLERAAFRLALVHLRGAQDEYIAASERSLLASRSSSQCILHVLVSSSSVGPYCYFDPDQKKKVLAPEYGGDGKEVGRCASKKGNIAYFPAHWAPNGLLF